MKIDIIERLIRNKILYFSLTAVVLFTVSVFINFNGSFAVMDPDGFYHIRHAWLLRTNGIFDTSFPWTQYSVTRTLGGDLWYGFHLFLIPFTFMSDLVWGIKISGVVITWLALFLYFLAIHRFKLRMALLWPLILPFASPTILSRFVVTRPHPISVGLNMLLFSFLIKGGVWPVFLISFFASFVHLNLFWVPILTLGIVIIARLINKQPLENNKTAALLSGLAAGALARPHPVATLKLNYIQLVDLTLQKIKGVKLAFGNELFPMGLYGQTIYVLLAFMVLVILLVWLIKKHLTRVSVTDKITAWTLMVLTTIYLILTVFAAVRSIDLFLGYLFMFAAFTLTLCLKYELDNFHDRTHKLIKIIIIAFVVGLVSYNVVVKFNRFNEYMPSLDNPYLRETPAKWLEKNSEKGDIVFHLGWARFAELFFWNQHNYYISAMDPIFMFIYNPNLYWESHFLSTGEGGEYTCSQRKCTKEEAVKTDVVLRDHFHASYVYVTSLKDRWPEVFYYMALNPKKYKMIFLDPGTAIFRVI